VPKGTAFWAALVSPDVWQWQGVIVGAVTVIVMIAAPKLTRAVPAAILALAAGVLAYFGLGLADRTLLELSGNPLVVGPFGGSDAGFLDGIVARWNGISGVELVDLAGVLHARVDARRPALD
jgi:SulP family sulfate permease